MAEWPVFRTMMLCILLAAALLARRVDSAFSADSWKTEPEPVLTAGQLADWDDFQVGSPCVVRDGKGWRMYFEGARLNEDGLSHGLGVAMSDDGRTWRKHPDNPVLVAESPEELRSPTIRLVLPAVSRLSNGSWLMMCTEIDQKHGTSRLRVLRSADGFDWQYAHDSEADRSKAASGSKLFSPSFCANPHRSGPVQLWCLKKADGGNINDVTQLNVVMLQTVEGTTWKQLSERTFSEIEPSGSVWDIRMAVKGDRWVIGYLFAEGDARVPTLMRFRRSPDGIRWSSAGIPDYVFPEMRDSDRQIEISRSALLHTENETQILYTVQRENGSRHIAAAFFSKASANPAP